MFVSIQEVDGDQTQKGRSTWSLRPIEGNDREVSLETYSTVSLDQTFLLKSGETFLVNKVEYQSYSGDVHIISLIGDVM